MVTTYAKLRPLIGKNKRLKTLVTTYIDKNYIIERSPPKSEMYWVKPRYKPQELASWVDLCGELETIFNITKKRANSIVVDWFSDGINNGNVYN